MKHQKRFELDLGSLERQRRYELLFEVRIPPASEGEQELGQVTLDYVADDLRRTESAPVKVRRVSEAALTGIKNSRVENVFRVVDALRHEADFARREETLHAGRKLL